MKRMGEFLTALGVTIGLMLVVVPDARCQQKQPIKMAVAVSLTGPLAFGGIAQTHGAELAVELINNAGGILGRPVVLVTRDDEAKPATAIKVVRELNSTEGVHLFMGTGGSAVALALKPVLQELNSLVITCGAHSTKITGLEWSPNVFRITDNAATRNYAFVDLLREKHPGIHKWANVSPDYEYGHSCWDHFTKKMKEKDPSFSITTDRWPKFGAGGGYGPDINAAIASGAEALYSNLYGSDLLAFIREAKGFGLFDRIKLFAISELPTDVPYALGKDMVDLWAGAHYLDLAYNNPEAQKFNKAYRAKFGADYFAVTHSAAVASYDAVNAYKAAIEKAKTDDPKAVMKALENLRIKSPLGEKWIRPGDHQAFFDIPFYHIVPDGKEPRGWRFESWAVIRSGDIQKSFPVDEAMKY